MKSGLWAIVPALMALSLLGSTASATLVANYTLAWGDITDSSGNGHDATIVGTVTNATDGYGAVFDQDVTPSFLNITDSPTPSAFDFPYYYTFSAWVKSNCGVSSNGLFGKGGAPYDNKAVLMFEFESNNRLYMCRNYICPLSISGVTTVCDNSWHYVVSTLGDPANPINRRHSIYFDGVQTGNEYACVGGGCPATTSTSDTVKIGAYEWLGTFNGLNGTMYSVQFYDDAKNSTWVADQYALGLPDAGPNPNPPEEQMGQTEQVLSDVGYGIGALLTEISGPLMGFIVILAIGVMVGVIISGIGRGVGRKV